MKKKALTYVAGIILFLPVIFAFICNDTFVFIFAVVYGIILFNSPKFSTRIKNFWRRFWKIQKSIEMSLEEYER